MCGKEIGSLRLGRDDEFCSAAHRKQYRERLGKLLSAPLPLQRPTANSRLPVKGFLPLEFFCRQTAGAPSHQAVWCTQASQPLLPALTLAPRFEPLEEAPPAKPQRAARPKRDFAAWRPALRAAAVCLAVGCTLWIGVNVLRAVGQGPATGKPSTMARFRQAISIRAASTVSDTFGAGYVQNGPLVLFRPSPHYRDYHLEFCGEIESKSIDWAVRARDAQNYYAMKLTVIEPGLRPIVAIVHYPVTDGRKGTAVQIPLNVMVHNHQPMHVDVDVRGNKLLTSIDGQLVDTWIDDALSAGGVGFFSEAGERARVYWVTVSRNDDLVGRICSYLSRALGDDPPTEFARRRRSRPWTS